MCNQRPEAKLRAGDIDHLVASVKTSRTFETRSRRGLSGLYREMARFSSSPLVCNQRPEGKLLSWRLSAVQLSPLKRVKLSKRVGVERLSGPYDENQRPEGELSELAISIVELSPWKRVELSKRVGVESFLDHMMETRGFQISPLVRNQGYRSSFS